MMAVVITKIDVWSGEIQDRCGGLTEKIEALVGAGVNLEFVIARRAPDKPGTGLVFLAPPQGAAQARAAKAGPCAVRSNPPTAAIWRAGSSRRNKGVGVEAGPACR